jgi:hypothetical protein
MTRTIGNRAIGRSLVTAPSIVRLVLVGLWPPLSRDDAPVDGGGTAPGAPT